MAGPYTEVAQDDEDRNHDDPSTPVSLSPAPSSSPMPVLPSAAASTFTPLSMDSDSYLSHGVDSKSMHGDDSGEKGLLISTPGARKAGAVDLPESVSALARATAAALRPTKHEYEMISPSMGSAHPSSPTSSPANTSAAASLQGDHPVAPSQALACDGAAKLDQDHNRDPSAPVSVSASIENNNLQQPTIIKPTPILRTASTRSVKLVHPSPSVRSRSSSHASIAQLEAKAEKLSMTSSIEDAIRDLHAEQKRSDSRRSSILAASIASGSDNNKDSLPFAARPLPPAASFILETNIAARHGGYSPAGYVMSPNPSLLSNPSRLRSSSHPRSDADPAELLLSRHGPGKGSTRSVRSATKPSLTDIAEMEPTGLTLAAMDEADRLGHGMDEPDRVQVPLMEDIDLTPDAGQHHTATANDYWDQAVAEVQNAQQHENHQQEPGSPTGSTTTFEQAEMAFADFDGAHCSPEADHDTFTPHDLDLSLQGHLPEDMDRPRLPHASERPKSYMDPSTGQQMMYYPARVPLMLNLPQKLSKRPKYPVQSKRRSQMLDAMPEANQEESFSSWLPEVVSGPLLDTPGSRTSSNLPTPVPLPESTSEPLALATPLEDGFNPQARPNPRPLDEEARKSRLSVLDPTDKRKSRLSYAFDKLPPQLRASAFFDKPSEPSNVHVELKNGSAMATLDSILDASAKAPVSAFTDHAFAGKLGTEVYGHEKKKKSHLRKPSAVDHLEVKKRSSLFHLRSPSKLSLRSASKEERPNTTAGSTLGLDHDEASDDEHGHREHGEDEADEEEDELDVDPAVYGPPTTLLAELQIRKHQQKLRTRAPAQAYPNGMYSTLLEMDTVAEVERKNRKAKKINLAWEEQDEVADESDDDDVPLGLLAAKNNGMDYAAMQAEINRPLGLMEQRELDDNEPLSRRRNRLQGRTTARQSMLNLGGGVALGMSGGAGPPSPNLRALTPEQPEVEIEGETLAERARRLKGEEEGDNPLPRARPVSTAFSVEMLNQLGDAFKDEEKEKAEAEKAKQKAAPNEEEETLGQRRRRLQAEREAREKEMGGVAGLTVPEPDFSKRHSMADVLGVSRKTVLVDPRAEATRTKEEEAARYRKEQERKMAVLRAQMPTTLITPNHQRTGGYMAGQFNDGNAGGYGRGRVQSSYGVPAGGMGINGGANGGMVGNGGYGMGAVGGYGMANAHGQAGFGYGGMPVQTQALQMQMPVQQPGYQYDRVNQWRQSIIP